ncbi:MAG: hypothetical protein ACRD9S_20720 [Pyrinomonadaceae bacterium]
MKALDIICYCAFVAALIALPFLVVNWVIYIRRQPVHSLATAHYDFPTKSTSFFLIACVTAMVAATIMTTYARDEALSFIQNLSGNYTAYVNEQEVRNPDKLISALKETRPYSAHHSHPTKRIRVLIRSGEKDLRLELRRDSDNPREYWVFSLGHEVTSNNEIGRITTEAFDEY